MCRCRSIRNVASIQWLTHQAEYSNKTFYKTSHPEENNTLFTEVMSEALKRDYCIGEEIGHGRFGVVFRCHSLRSGTPFAVKTIDKRSIAQDSVDYQCINNEAKLMQALSPNMNILQVFDLYEDDDHLHIVTELCASADLFHRITLNRAFTEQEAVAVMVPLMKAIARCHSLCVAHRDVKPDNVLFDERGCLKLADFGSARWFGEGEGMVGVVGTPYYVAPEVVAGKEYGEKVDVWSAGVVLYVMLAGFPPFYGDTAAEVFEAVLRGNLRFPATVFGSVSPAAKDLMRRMVCKDVGRRVTAEQVLRHPWMTVGE